MIGKDREILDFKGNIAVFLSTSPTPKPPSPEKRCTGVGSLKNEPTVVKKNLNIKGHQWKITFPAIQEFFPNG